jgi:anti-sigma B factor antagonist
MSSFYISDDVTATDLGGENVAVLVAGGEIDYEASPQLKEHIVSQIKSGRRRLVLDLSSATFIDSTAIGVLVGAVTKLDEAGGGSLAVVCEHEKVLQIFEMVGLDSLIALHRSRAEALSALAMAG